jgi:hypothetical protein
MVMNSPLQTIAALAIVGIAAIALVHRALAKRPSSGCGGNCGAVSPEVKKLQAHLKRMG